MHTIIVKYLFYDLDPDQKSGDVRNWKWYIGDIAGFKLEIIGRPLDEVDIHYLNPLSDVNDLVDLANVIKNCNTLAKPYKNNIS